LKTYFECLPCMMRQAVEAARHALKDETLQEEALRLFMEACAKADLSRPTPVHIGTLHTIIRRLTGNPDPYRAAKDRFNHAALSCYSKFKTLIEQSPDPIETALRTASAGNTIDMVVDGKLENASIDHALNRITAIPVPRGFLDRFKARVSQSRNILYLGDNAGEIVFDRLLIESLPGEKITYVVRGAPVINDVTFEDARAVGMTEIVPVIDNGSDLPGTILENCSESFRERFADADFVIAKGQGNLESLDEADRTIAFILKAKCVVITLTLGYEIGRPVYYLKER
jgi:uncharacterized protein with ATP-grasp and redox domains